MSDAHALGFLGLLWWGVWIVVFHLDPSYGTTTPMNALYGTIVAGVFIAAIILVEAITERLRAY